MEIDMKTELQIDTNYYKVLDLRQLTENTFILSMPKSRFKFVAGQHISLSIMGDYQSREYSIYSAEEGENLEAGKKSYALSFLLQDETKTLTDVQIDKIMQKLQTTFEKNAGATLR